MTGWQTAEGHGPSFLQHHQEAMELSRVISQLAVANQQLASAHTTTLSHLEELYKQLRNERESKRREDSPIASDEAVKKRLTTDHVEKDDEGRQRLELRIDRLENLLRDNWDDYQDRQRNLQQEEDRNYRSRIDRLELTPEAPGPEDEDGRTANVCSSTNRDSQMDQQTNDDGVVRNRITSSIDVPEHEFASQSTVDAVDDKYQTRSVHRTRSNEELSDSRSTDETDRSTADLHLEKPESETNVKDEERSGVWKVNKLVEEIVRLKAERLEYRYASEKFASELDEQTELVKKLTENYEVRFGAGFMKCLWNEDMLRVNPTVVMSVVIEKLLFVSLDIVKILGKSLK